MWIVFFLAFCVVAVIQSAPGYLLLKGLRFTRVSAFCCSAPVSSALIALLGILFQKFNITINWYVLASSAFIVGGTVYGVSSLLAKLKEYKPNHLACLQCSIPVLVSYILFSITVLILVYITALESPDSFSQQSDNMFHLGLIKAMARSGVFSTLDSNVYQKLPISQIPYFNNAPYPAAWHISSALAASCMHVSAACAENATNLVFTGIVYPSGMYLLLAKLYSRIEKRVLILGSFVTVASVAFPFGLFVFGPLYPNAASLACLPAVAFLFMSAFDSFITKKEFPEHCVAFFLASVGIAVLQPNSIFFAIVFLTPYCVYRLKDISKLFRIGRSAQSRRWLRVARLCFILMVVSIWTILFYAPFMSQVVGFKWASLFSPAEGIKNVATFGLRFGVPQVAVSLLILVGLIKTLANREHAWIGVAFITMVVFYFVGATQDGFFKSFLTGFWYTDQWRTAAVVGVISVPLSALGFHVLLNLTSKALALLQHRCGIRSTVSPSIMLSVLVAVLIVIYCPSMQPGPNGHYSAFVEMKKQLSLINSKADSNSYTDKEERFVRRVKRLTGEGIVINFPADGSISAYLSNELNVYYKSFPPGDPSQNESRQSALIRNSLVDYKSSPSVRNAVEAVGAQYLVLLDRNGFVDEGDTQWSLCGSYAKSQWQGLLRINDKTPGLKLVLSDGPLRLYKFTHV